MKIFGKFKALVKEYGTAQVAVWLKYRDSRVIQIWLKKGIPDCRHADVVELLKEHQC